MAKVMADVPVEIQIIFQKQDIIGLTIEAFPQREVG